MAAAERPLAGSSCPDEELIGAFVDGTMADDERARIDEHVARCVECRAVIAALGAEMSPPPQTKTVVAGAIVPAPPPASGAVSAQPLRDVLAVTRVGEVVDGKWRLLRLLGAGGMGQVFAAEHIETGVRAALKILRVELSTQHEIVRRFVRERHAVNRIDHRAFVRVIDDGATMAGQPYFAMELVDGITLRRTIKARGPLPESEVIAVGEKLLDAVTAAHEAGVLHRDIKPDNIALDRDGNLRILDFGIAKVTSHEDEPSITGGGTTITGQLLGTPTYMPPEQARGLPAEIDGRVDVFAVGATLFFLATGTGVRSGTSALFEAMTQPVPPVRSLAPAMSPRLARVLDRALAFDKRDRYPTPAAMREALLADAASVPSEWPPPPPPAAEPTSAPRRSRSTPIWIGGLLALLVAVGLGFALAWRARAPRGASSSPISASAASGSGVSAAAATVEAPMAPVASAEPSASPTTEHGGTSAPEAASAKVVSTGAPQAGSSARAAAPGTGVRPKPRASSATELPKDMTYNPYR